MEIVDFSKGRLVGTLEGRFPWGLLVIAGEGSSEPVPSWATTDEQVTSTSSSVVVRVEHEQDGPAIVHVYDGVGDLVGEPAFAGALTTTRGALTVGDALGKQMIRVPVAAETMKLRVFLDRPAHAAHVDVVLN